VNELCVDASVAIKWAIKGEPFRAKARALLPDCGKRGIMLIAPAFFTAETDSAIRRRVFQAKMTFAEAKKAFAVLDAVPVRILYSIHTRKRAREIAEQFNQATVYDATYAALAESRGCEFRTADKQFHDTVKAVLRFVKYLPDYP
jgi:predicted nucleic acid-binding protein